MKQSEFIAIICNLLKAQEESRVQGTIGFSSNRLKTWREIFNPIIKYSNHNHLITFDSRLKTDLKHVVLKF